MTNLIETLFNYAQAHAIAAFLAEDEEYEPCIRCAQAQEARLRAALGPDGEVPLKALLDEQDLLCSLLERAAFFAGFRMAMELAR